MQIFKHQQKALDESEKLKSRRVMFNDDGISITDDYVLDIFPVNIKR